MGRHERQDRRERDYYRDQRPLRQKPGWGYHFRVIAILGVVIAVACSCHVSITNRIA